MLSQEVAGIRPTSKKNRRLVLTESHCPESVPLQCNPVHRPSFLVENLDHTPSAVIQRGGRVGLFSVPHGRAILLFLSLLSYF